MSDSNPIETFSYIAERLNKLGTVYLHVSIRLPMVPSACRRCCAGNNADKRARREAKPREREEQAELEARYQRFKLGLPLFDDDAPPPVPRGRGKPPWQAHSGRSPEPRALETLGVV